MRIKKLPKVRVSGAKLSRIKMPPLRIGDTVARIPIVQGGMGVGISLSGLASAVANAGGIGVIAANAIGMLESDYFTNGKEANKRALRKEIQKARRLSNGAIGVNIMVAVNDFHELLQVSIEEKVDMVFLGAGLPLKGIPVHDLKKARVKVIPIVSSARAARLIFKYWQNNYNTIPDALVVEGPKAGGHLGFKENEILDSRFALENILPEVVAELKTFERQFDREIPVIAAGGIYYGEDIYTFLKLGASGVQLATRFVATHECDAALPFKEAYIRCREEDITIIRSPVGLPGRAIKNAFLRKIDNGVSSSFRCPWRCLESCNAKKAKYCISEALDNARRGYLDKGFAFAGANAHRIKEIVPVRALIKSLKKEYFKIVKNDTVDIRNELLEAAKRLRGLRDQYVKTTKKSIKTLKKQINELLERKANAFWDDYKHAIFRLDNLKKEYITHFEKLHDLKEQLSRYFDISSLKLPGTSHSQT